MRNSPIHQSPAMQKYGERINLIAAMLIVLIFVIGIKDTAFFWVPLISLISMPLHIAMAQNGIPKSLASFVSSYLSVFISASVVFGAGLLIGSFF